MNTQRVSPRSDDSLPVTIISNSKLLYEGLPFI